MGTPIAFGKDVERLIQTLTPRDFRLKFLLHHDLEFTSACFPDISRCPAAHFRQGYRHRIVERARQIEAAVTRSRLLFTFRTLVESLGDTLHVILASFHGGRDNPRIFWRYHIDRPVLERTIIDFEDLLLEDGCTGIWVVRAGGAGSLKDAVLLDDHKCIVVTAKRLDTFEGILQTLGLVADEGLHVITDVCHVHTDTRPHAYRCMQFRHELCAYE